MGTHLVLPCKPAATRQQNLKWPKICPIKGLWCFEQILAGLIQRVGLLFCIAYAVDDIRYAVCDYVPEVFFPPFGLLAFFAVGASVGLLCALLFVPEAILNKPGNREDLQQILGVSGAIRVRAFSAGALALIFFAISLIYSKAYG